MLFKNSRRVLLIRFVKLLFFKTPLWRYFLPTMKFDMTVGQLNFMLETISEIKSEGIIFEVGNLFDQVQQTEYRKDDDFIQPFR